MKRWTVRWTVASAGNSDELHWDHVVRSTSAREAIAQIRSAQALPSNVKIIAFAHH